MIKHIRWQAFIAFAGILILLGATALLSTRFGTVQLAEAGGTYREALVGSPTNLNPLYATTQTDRDVTALIFNGLLRADARGLLNPDLATDWSVSPDGQRYTFTLREDMVWHDGEPLTAADVAFTIRILQDPSYSGNDSLKQVWQGVSVEVLNPQTIAVILPEDIAPFAPFPSFATFAVLPQHLLSEVPVEALATSEFSRRPVGSGPWKVENVEPDQIALVPHEAYPGEAPQLERLVFRFYPSMGEAIRAYRENEVLGIADVRPNNLSSVTSIESLNLYTAPLTTYTALFFNMERPLMQELPIREALVWSVDRDELLEEVLSGSGLIANGFLMPAHWAAPQRMLRIPYQPRAAEAQLEELGWTTAPGESFRTKDERTLRVTFLVNEGNDERRDVAEWITAQWESAGIEVELRVLDAQSLLNRLDARDFDVVLLSPSRGNAPSDPDFYPLWHSSQIGSGLNITAFDSEAGDDLLEEARRTLDQEQRAQIYGQFQQLLASELPALPLYHSIYNYAVNEQISDIAIGPLQQPADRFTSLSSWMLRTRRYIRVPAGSATVTP